MLLIDTLHALHYRLPPMYSTSELFIKMPSSNHRFRTIYNSLFYGHKLPQDATSREDALLLLSALLSDILYLQRCQASLHSTSSFPSHSASGADDSVRLQNPFAPLTSRSEFPRLAADLETALERWQEQFQHVGSDILALYCFTKLQLICPNIWELLHRAGYGVATELNGDHPKPCTQFEVSDKAMDLAWVILDHCDKSSKFPERRLAVWMPLVLFMSALTIWHKLNAQATTDLKYGTLRVLSMFKDEIALLPWPCCAEMTKTLDKLMER